MEHAWVVIVALLVVLVAIGHSWLGERKVLQALDAAADPQLTRMRKRFLRAGWHIGTMGWLALAGVLGCLYLPAAQLQIAVLLIVACVFLLTGVANFAISAGKNVGWIGCAAIASMSIAAVVPLVQR